jgi:hypothetical protein
VQKTGLEQEQKLFCFELNVGATNLHPNAATLLPKIGCVFGKITVQREGHSSKFLVRPLSRLWCVSTASLPQIDVNAGRPSQSNHEHAYISIANATRPFVSMSTSLQKTQSGPRINTKRTTRGAAAGGNRVSKSLKLMTGWRRRRQNNVIMHCRSSSRFLTPENERTAASAGCWWCRAREQQQQRANNSQAEP